MDSGGFLLEVLLMLLRHLPVVAEFPLRFGPLPQVVPVPVPVSAQVQVQVQLAAAVVVVEVAAEVAEPAAAVVFAVAAVVAAELQPAKVPVEQQVALAYPVQEMLLQEA